MAKFKKKIRALRLRRSGTSIKDIARMLGVAKSTASVWCSDIKLTDRQIENLHKQMVAGGHRGRMIGAALQRNRKIERIISFQKKGIAETRNLTKKELLMLGLGLYLGEGNKGGNQFQFANSNPEIIKIILLWLENIFNFSRKNIYGSVFINESHKDRENYVKNQWSRLIGISSDQFRKTIFIKSKNKKIYTNKNSHLGTLIIRARKSSGLHYRILGLIYGLIYNLNKGPA